MSQLFYRHNGPEISSILENYVKPIQENRQMASDSAVSHAKT